jgi:hypothetical protein
MSLAACRATAPGPSPAAAPAAAPVTPAPAAASSQVLFDGRTLDGWVGDTAVWSVKDGAIDGATEKGGFLLYSREDYGSFRLTLTSRLVSEKNHLGVCFWGERRPDNKYGGCILVIPPDGGMWDYIINKTPPRDKTLRDPPLDPHQWHRTEILADLATGEVQVAVDGFHTTRYKDVDPARLRKGPIGLQVHAGASQVQYKDLVIEVDPKEKRLLSLK